MFRDAIIILPAEVHKAKEHHEQEMSRKMREYHGYNETLWWYTLHAYGTAKPAGAHNVIVKLWATGSCFCPVSTESG